MSLITFRIQKDAKHSVVFGQADRTPITSSTQTISSFARKAIIKSTALFIRAVQALAEARAHRAMIEAELYLNRYRHSSKNDDDLPIVR